MDIGNLKSDYTYYNGYEGEGEIIIRLEMEEEVHIWEGYFEDIYDIPPLTGNGWKGFTRDYNQLEGIFSEEDIIMGINPEEYLGDLMLYKDKQFEFAETIDVFKLIKSLLEKSIKENKIIKVEKI